MWTKRTRITRWPLHLRHCQAWPSTYTQLPTIAALIPNLCNNMHDCDGATGDRWLIKPLSDYLAWAGTHNSLLLVTLDESDSSHGGNQIVTCRAVRDFAPVGSANLSTGTAIQSVSPRRSTISVANALAWATLPAGAGPGWLRMRITVVRGFTAYLAMWPSPDGELCRRRSRFALRQRRTRRTVE